jgi:hypothetical protein
LGFGGRVACGRAGVLRAFGRGRGLAKVEGLKPSPGPVFVFEVDVRPQTVSDDGRKEARSVLGGNGSGMFRGGKERQTLGLRWLEQGRACRFLVERLKAVVPREVCFDDLIHDRPTQTNARFGPFLVSSSP